LQFEKGKRQDLVEKEKTEIKILQKYLPEQLSENEIKKLAEEIIKKIRAKKIHTVKSAESSVPPKAE
jgi:uncharacterized protein YqeY